jgi:hypothetical protein
VALQLARRGLEAQVEQLDLRLGQLVVQLCSPEARRSAATFQCLGHHASPTSRLTNLHFIGSLCMARPERLPGDCLGHAR